MAMSGEPIRLLHDTSIRDEIRQRLVREAAVKPQYDFDRAFHEYLIPTIRERYRPPAVSS